MELLKNNNQLLATKSEELRNYELNLKSVTVQSNMSLLEVRKLNFPPVSRLVIKSESGVDKSLCYEFLSNYISNVLIFFGEEWKADTIYDLAESIYADFYYLTLADWKLLAQRIKSSYYGKVYGKFTPAVLMGWISQYAGEWTQTSIDISLSGHDAHRRLTDSREQRERDAELIQSNTMYHKLLTK